MRSRSDEELFALPRRPAEQQRERPHAPQRAEHPLAERPRPGMAPKEKKKSTPIRPSLMGSTLIDGGTLMLWKCLI